MGSRRSMPEPSYHWPSGPGADDDPTPLESALAALKLGAILAAAVTIAFIYLGTYAGVSARPAKTTWLVLASFLAPSLIAALRTAWVRRRRGGGEGR